MISVSGFRRRIAPKANRARRLAWIAGFLALGTGGCVESHACTAIGCLDGLLIYLDGSFDPGTTYQIVVNRVTQPADPGPFMTCTLGPAATGGDQRLSCVSTSTHSESGKVIEIQDNKIQKMAVAVSAGGVTLGEQTFEPTYTTKELNGAGCGSCTSATIHLTIP